MYHKPRKISPHYRQTSSNFMRVSQDSRTDNIHPIHQVRRDIDSLAVPTGWVAFAWTEADADAVDEKPVSTVCRHMNGAFLARSLCCPKELFSKQDKRRERIAFSFIEVWDPDPFGSWSPGWGRGHCVNDIVSHCRNNETKQYLAGEWVNLDLTYKCRGAAVEIESDYRRAQAWST
jgi:hypothetical protein